MHLLHSLQHPLAFLDSGPWVIGIVVPVVALIFAALVGISSMYFRSQERERWHQTARVALENGQPLPSLPEAPRLHHQGRPDTPAADLRRGLVLVGLGVGLYLFLGAFLGRGFAYVGAIPGFIGVAMILYALGALLFSRKTPLQDPPPRS